MIGRLIEVKSLSPFSVPKYPHLIDLSMGWPVSKISGEVSCPHGNIPEHRAENREIKRGGGYERGYGVVVTGELMALRKKGRRDEGPGCDLFIQLTEGQRIKMRNGCRE